MSNFDELYIHTSRTSSPICNLCNFMQPYLHKVFSISTAVALTYNNITQDN